MSSKLKKGGNGPKKITLPIPIKERFLKGIKEDQEIKPREFPAGPVVKTLCSHCRGHRFNPCWKTKTLHATHSKKKK